MKEIKNSAQARFRTASRAPTPEQSRNDGVHLNSLQKVTESDEIPPVDSLVYEAITKPVLQHIISPVATLTRLPVDVYPVSIICTSGITRMSQWLGMPVYILNQ